MWKTNQLCYVAEKVGKLLLSKEALLRLGIINKSFPAVGSAETSAPVVSEVTEQNTDQFDLEPCTPEVDGSCNCPRREPVRFRNPQSLTLDYQQKNSGRELSNTTQPLLSTNVPDKPYQ